MRAILAWLDGHPAFVAGVMWPIVTAIINTVWQDASAYADRYPRLAAVKKLVQKWGLSPRGTIVLLAKAVSLAPPPLPPPDPPAGFEDEGCIPKIPRSPRTPSVTLSLALFFLVSGCASKPGKTPAQVTASTAVLALAEGVKLADQFCADEALAKRDAKLAKKCADAYDVARPALLSAERDVAIWGDLEKQKLGCVASDALTSLSLMREAAMAAGGSMPPIITEALALARAIAGPCDRGAP